MVRYDGGIKGGFHVLLKALKLLGKSRWFKPPRSILNFIDKFCKQCGYLRRVLSRGSLVNVYSRVHVTIIPSLYEVAEKIRAMYNMWFRYRDVYGKLIIIFREISRKFDITLNF